ncbi:hypothetical protein EXS66_00590 [Candidatus Saccharibacteria bacterium]|nr:hypothetical protein [Candidatus Saccharibacteria bacterium]
MEANNPLNNPTSAPSGPSLPNPSALNLTPPTKKKTGLILAIGFGIGIVVLLLVALIVVSGNSSKTKKADLDAQYQKGLTQGVADQTVVSNNELLAQAYVYKSPPEFGSFEIPIPKLWSSAVEPKPTDGTIIGYADPNYIDLESDFHKFKLQLKRADYDKVIKEYDDKSKKIGSNIKATDFTVSGITGRKYVGIIDDKNKQKSEVVIIPLREKIMIFSTDDADNYGAIFEGILKGTKLVP